MPAARARSIEEYLVCPFRGYLHAYQHTPPPAPQARAIASDDDREAAKAAEYPWVDPITVAGGQPLTATLKTEAASLTLTGLPDLAAEDRSRRGVAAVIESSRTPRWAPRRRLEALTARATAYALIVEACTKIPSVPVAASTHTPWAIIPRSRALKALAKAVDGLAGAARTGWAEPRPGNYCLHCAYQPLCPAR